MEKKALFLALACLFCMAAGGGSLIPQSAECKALLYGPKPQNPTVADGQKSMQCVAPGTISCSVCCSLASCALVYALSLPSYNRN